jgi:hypothetical protein
MSGYMYEHLCARVWLGTRRITHPLKREVARGVRFPVDNIFDVASARVAERLMEPSTGDLGYVADSDLQ